MIFIRKFFTPQNKRKLAFFFIGCLLCISVDQALKYWVRTYMSIFKKPITSFFTLVHAWNPGISFGLFPCHNPLSRYLLLFLSCSFITMLFSWYWKSETSLQKLSFILIIGGAFGNIIDRIKFGAVFDFLRFQWHYWHFPAFNVADMLITLGFLLLMFDHIKWKIIKKY